jgi:hypothetical protein
MRVHTPLSCGLEGGNGNLYTKVVNISTTQLEAPNNVHKALTTLRMSCGGEFFWLGFQGPKRNKFLDKMGGKIKSLW